MLTSMDQFSITDKNKEISCVEKQNMYCFKYLALFSICNPQFAHLTYLQLFEKNFLLNFVAGPFKALGCQNWTTVFVSGPYA